MPLHRLLPDAFPRNLPHERRSRLALPASPIRINSARPKAEKAAAAGSIQASVKGFETRKAAAEKRTGRPVTIKPEPANSKANAKPKAAKASPEEKAKAAGAIQASVKGFEARKTAASKVAQRPIEVKNDPANSKKKQQQPQKAMTEEEKAAAQSIQASVNSYKTRKQVAKQQAGKSTGGGA